LLQLLAFLGVFLLQVLDLSLGGLQLAEQLREKTHTTVMVSKESQGHSGKKNQSNTKKNNMLWLFFSMKLDFQ
jgi:hypothetical protein